MLRWSGPSWATGYAIEVDDSGGFDSPSFSSDQIPAATLAVTTSPLADGLWYWHVKAKQSNGDWGNWSLTQSFFVDQPWIMVDCGRISGGEGAASDRRDLDLRRPIGGLFSVK
jgi:hypothetical protein